MHAVATRYLEHLKGSLQSKDAQLPFYSSVSCEEPVKQSNFGPQYWVDNLTSPVRFSSAVSEILHLTVPKTFVEIGPHSALAGPLRQIFKSAKASADYINVLSRGQDSQAEMLKALGELWSGNHNLDLLAIVGKGDFLTDLPLYPWHYEERLWHESRLAREWRLREFPHHDILGSRVLESTDHSPSWRNLLRVDAVSWTKEHEVAGDIVFPGVGYLCMAGEAVRQLTGSSDFTVRRVHFKAAMIMNQDVASEVVTQLQKISLTSSADSNWYSFSISSYQNGAWLKHMFGEVCGGSSALSAEAPSLAPLPRAVSKKALYRKVRAMGLEYGPRFMGMTDITADTAEPRLMANLHNDTGEGESQYAIHPATLDCIPQALSPAATFGLMRRSNPTMLPTYIDEMYIRPPPTPEMAMQVVITEQRKNGMIGDAVVVSKGELVVHAKGFEVSLIGDSGGEVEDAHAAVELEWKQDINLTEAAPLIQPAKDRTDLHASLDKFASICMLEASENLSQIEQPSRAHMEYYRKWLSSIASEILTGRYSGVEQNDEDVASMTPGQRQGAMAALRAQLRETEAHAAAEAIYRVTKQCVAIAEGATDELALLLEDDILHQLYDFMQNSEYSAFLDLVAHQKPNLRVLEIGAGTGGTTATVLPVLRSAYGERMYFSYTYTDVSAGFFPAAKRRFKEYAAVHYAVLDISKDPLGQGFQPESYDLIIACNVSFSFLNHCQSCKMACQILDQSLTLRIVKVLHATPSINETLSNVRKLLHPEGRLFLQELDPRKFNV